MKHTILQRHTLRPAAPSLQRSSKQRTERNAHHAKGIAVIKKPELASATSSSQLQNTCMLSLLTSSFNSLLVALQNLHRVEASRADLTHASPSAASTETSPMTSSICSTAGGSGGSSMSISFGVAILREGGVWSSAQITFSRFSSSTCRTQWQASLGREVEVQRTKSVSRA